MKGWKIIVAIIVIAGVAAGGWQWQQKQKEKALEQAANENLVATASRRSIESNLLLTGEVTPAFQVDVKAEVGGKVKEINVQIGQTVKKGDVLAVIDDVDLLTEKGGAETEVEGAQLSVEKTKGNHDRAKALFDQRLISREAFTNLQADLAIAENSLEKARSRLRIVEDRLRKTRILAPADGTVLDILVNEQQVVVAAASVNSGTILMNFADLSRLLIYSHVNQMDATRLTTGLPVEVNFSDMTDQPVRAHLEFIAPLATVKNNIKGFEVQAEIDDNDGRLKPGMSVSMHVPVGKVSDAVSVPVSAVFRDQKKNIVYVRKGGVTERRTVSVGLTDFSFAEIKSGVKEGEEILLSEPPDQPSKS